MTLLRIWLFLFPALAYSTVGLGGRIGVAIPDEIDATFTFGFFANFDVAPNFQIQAGLDYWQESEQTGNHTLEVSDLAMTGTGVYVFSVPKSKFKPYMGFGFGIHNVSIENQWPWGIIDDDDTEFGFHFLGGGKLSVTRSANVLGEFRFSAIDDFGYDAFSITWGLEFLLPQSR